MAKRARVAAISCSHVPHHSQSAINKLIELIGTLNDDKPFTHFVHMGDLLDAQAASVHPDDPADHSLLDEYHAAAELLASIRQVLNPRCHLHWLLGNHDSNILQRNPKRIPVELRPLCNWNNVPVVGREFHKWQQTPYVNGRESCLEIGPLIFLHGFKCGVNSDELEGLEMAYACGGFAHRLICRGHTHSPVPIRQCRRGRIKLPWHVCNVGMTAFDIRPAYMERKSTDNWGRACLVAEADLTGWKEGRSWEAELVPLD
jgi:predicted phosphodiesterase